MSGISRRIVSNNSQMRNNKQNKVSDEKLQLELAKRLVKKVDKNAGKLKSE
jgi:Cu/Ag efflux protein CusF